jgi:hypothetical protein
MKKSKVIEVTLTNLICISFLTNTTYSALAPPAKTIDIRITGHMPVQL